MSKAPVCAGAFFMLWIIRIMSFGGFLCDFFGLEDEQIVISI